MRLNTRALQICVAALFAGSVAVAAVGHARAASPMAPQAPQRLDTENDMKYVEHLRTERKALGEVKDMLSKEDMADRANHRHDALEGIDKALTALDAEIAEYDKDMKNGK